MYLLLFLVCILHTGISLWSVVYFVRENFYVCVDFSQKKTFFHENSRNQCECGRQGGYNPLKFFLHINLLSSNLWIFFFPGNKTATQQSIRIHTSYLYIADYYISHKRTEIRSCINTYLLYDHITLWQTPQAHPSYIGRLQ